MERAGLNVLRCSFHPDCFDDMSHLLISFSSCLLIKLTFQSHVLKHLVIAIHQRHTLMSNSMSTLHGPVWGWTDHKTFLFLIWQPSWRKPCPGVEHSRMILAAPLRELFWERIPFSLSAALRPEQTHSLSLISSEISWEISTQMQGVSYITSLQSPLSTLPNQTS